MAELVKPELENFIRLEVLMTQACVTLQRIFKERWKNCTGVAWVDSPSSGQNFIETRGAKVYKKSGHWRRESLQSGVIQNWDLSTMLQILQNDDFEICKTDEEKSHLKNLVNFRNEQAHNPTKTISNDQFDEMWKDVAKALVFYGYSKETLDELLLTNNIGGTEFKPTKLLDPSSLKKANALKEKANKEMENSNFDEALKLYTEAITLPGISDEVLADLYCNRAGVFTRKAGSSSTKDVTALKNAIKNAKRAVELYPHGWEARFRLGSVYEIMDNYEEAILAFNQAVALNPLHKDAKSARDSCRHTLSKQKREDHLYPDNFPQSMEERLRMILPVLLSAEHSEQILRNAGDPLADVWKGHKFRDGLDEKQSYQMVAELYENAANNGNVEGMFSLAMLKLGGKGLGRDIEGAIELLKQAAVEPAVKDGFPNVGVADSEYTLGMLYMEGVGFDLNPGMARWWYERASEHGNGAAANNLACIYIDGIGVKRDEERAVQYWELAASRNVTLAMESLYRFYINQENSRKANQWFQSALKNGSIRAKLDQEKFKLDLQTLQEKEENSVLVEWEKTNCLERGDLSLRDRMMRMLTDNNPVKQSTLKQSFPYLREEKYLDLPIGTTDHPPFDKAELLAFAKMGSKIAKKMVKAITHLDNGIAALHKASAVPFDVVVRDFAECIKTDYNTAILHVEDSERLLTLVQERLREIPKNVISSFDLELRICFAFVKMNSLRDIMLFLEETIRKYSKERFFYYLRAYILGICGDHEEGFRKANEALILFPNDSELLNIKAANLGLIANADPYERIKAYKEFLKVAESDDRQVPEACYNIAYQYKHLSVKEENMNSLKQSVCNVKKWYEKGLEAEKKQLPCCLPYDSPLKQRIGNLLEMYEIYDGGNSSKTKYTTGTGTSSPSLTKMTSVLGVPQEGKLISQIRLLIIKDHREKFEKLFKRKSNYSAENKTTITQKPKPEQTFSSKDSSLKTITLSDMDSTKDHVYEGFSLQLTSIEDARPGHPFIALVVEDENKDVRRASVCSFVEDQYLQKCLGFGCKFSIMNPRMIIAVDGKLEIRVDDPSSLLRFNRDCKRCRFCGKGDCFRSCGRCGRAFYCSKECQIQDWKLCKHKAICMKQEEFNSLVVNTY